MRYLLFLIAILVTTTNISAQKKDKNNTTPDSEVSVTSLFLQAPDEIMPAIPDYTKLDMVDYFNYGSERTSENIFGGSSRILEINETDMTIEVSDVQKCQIILLKSGKEQMIAFISTLLTPIADSRIEFYDLQWQKLDKDIFNAPTLEEWLTQEGKQHITDIENVLQYTIASYQFDPKSSRLTLTNNIFQTLSPADKEIFSQYFISSITYQWNGKKMKKLK